MNVLLKCLLIASLILKPILPTLTVLPIDFEIYHLLTLILTIITFIEITIYKDIKLYKNIFILSTISSLFVLFIIGLYSLNEPDNLKIKASELSNLVIYIQIMILFLFCNSEKLYNYIFMILQSLNWIFLLYALYEILFDKHLSIANFSENINKNTIITYASGIFYNPNNLSVFLLLTYMIFFSKIKNTGIKIIQFFLIMFVMYVNDSMICMLLSFIFIYFMYIYSNKNRIKSKSLLIVTFLISISILTFYFILNKNDFSKLDTFETRINLIKVGWNLVLDKPFGYGPAMFSNVFWGNADTFYIRDPHSFFIEILVNYGFIGFFVFIIFLFSLIKLSLNLSKDKDELKSIPIAMIINLGLFFVMSTSFNFALNWIFFTLILSMSNYYSIKKLDQEDGVK